MGYFDVVIRVYIAVLGLLCVLSGPLVDSIHFCRVRDVQAEGMP